MRERATSRVFAGDTHRCAFVEKGSVCECFSEGPIDFAVFDEHLVSAFELLGQLGMNRESFGDVFEVGKDGLEFFFGHASIDVRKNAAEDALGCMFERRRGVVRTCFVEGDLKTNLEMDTNSL